jgi:hypothetical protein
MTHEMQFDDAKEGESVEASAAVDATEAANDT